jgi:hypothetical protein
MISERSQQELRWFAERGRIGPERQAVPTVTELRVTERVQLRGTVRISWRSVATDACTLRVSGGGRTQERIVPAAGATEIVADVVGELLVEVLPRGAGEPAARRTATVRVLAPPVAIAVSTTSIVADFDAPFEFGWRVTGARAVRVEARSRNEVHPAPAVGRLQGFVRATEELFLIVATGWDDREHARAVRITPRLVDVSEPLRDLDALSLGWE